MKTENNNNPYFDSSSQTKLSLAIFFIIISMVERARVYF
jgi:hypothetical protein